MSTSRLPLDLSISDPKLLEVHFVSFNVAPCPNELKFYEGGPLLLVLSGGITPFIGVTKNPVTHV